MNCIWQQISDPNNAQIVSAISTVAASFIALFALLFSIWSNRRQSRREAEASKPNVVVIDAIPDDHQFSFELLNLGNAPIFVAGVAHDSYKQTLEYRNPKLLIGANSKELYIFETSFDPESGGEFRIFFRYGLTGPVYHRLAFRYEKWTEVEKIRSDLGLTQGVDIPLSDQELTVGIGDDKTIFRKKLIAEEVFEH